MRIGACEIKQLEDLANCSPQELLAFYNEATGKETKRFASSEDRTNRLTKIITPILELEKQANARPAGKTLSYMNLPSAGKGNQRNPRTGSAREKALLFLKSSKNGKTLEQIAEHLETSRDKAYYIVRHLHLTLGYGLECKDGETVTIYI